MLIVRKPLTHWRRTKIVCTIGPASNSEEMIRRLIEAGMDVARFNMSHGSMAEHARILKLVRKVGEELGVEVAVMLDLPGPKHRIGKLASGQVTLRKGEKVILTERQVEGDSRLLPVTLPGFARNVKPGQTVLLDDGALQVRVLRTDGTEITGRITIGGVLVQGRGVVVPGMSITFPFLTDSLKDFVLFAIEQRPDYIALSFVSKPQDITDVRSILAEKGVDIPIIAKIEKRGAIVAFNEILKASDAIMVARGDLGVEITLERVPLVQKDIIKRCNRAGKPVITATEMLQSMVASARPVRAEVSDVANAIYDGTDAVMLSAETSIGQHPIEAVKMMDKIAVETEKKYPYELMLAEKNSWVGNVTGELISYNACLTAQSLNARAIIAFTQSGSTAGRVSKYRPGPVILAIAPGNICGRLVLRWGVHPFRAEVVQAPGSVSDLFSTAAELVKSTGLARPGDLIVVTGGLPLGVSGSTNLLKVETIT
jgi:pyruvate kinase